MVLIQSSTFTNFVCWCYGLEFLYIESLGWVSCILKLWVVALGYSSCILKGWSFGLMLWLKLFTFQVCKFEIFFFEEILNCDMLFYVLSMLVVDLLPHNFSFYLFISYFIVFLIILFYRGLKISLALKCLVFREVTLI